MESTNESKLKEHGKLWFVQSGARKKKEGVETYWHNELTYDVYVKLAQTHSTTDAAQINKDIASGRTDCSTFNASIRKVMQSVQISRHGNMNYEAGARDEMTRVLMAFTFRNPDPGYVQGMNYILCFLLCFMTEEEAFWTLCSVVEDMRLPGFYSRKRGSNMIGLTYECATLVKFIKAKIPELDKLLGEGEVKLMVQLFAMKTLHPLFINMLSFDLTVKIWDQFFGHVKSEKKKENQSDAKAQLNASTCPPKKSDAKLDESEKAQGELSLIRVCLALFGMVSDRMQFSLAEAKAKVEDEVAMQALMSQCTGFDVYTLLLDLMGKIEPEDLQAELLTDRCSVEVKEFQETLATVQLEHAMEMLTDFKYSLNRDGSFSSSWNNFCMQYPFTPKEVHQLVAFFEKSFCGLKEVKGGFLESASERKNEEVSMSFLHTTQYDFMKTDSVMTLKERAGMSRFQFYALAWALYHHPRSINSLAIKLDNLPQLFRAYDFCHKGYIDLNAFLDFVSHSVRGTVCERVVTSWVMTDMTHGGSLLHYSLLGSISELMIRSMHRLKLAADDRCPPALLLEAQQEYSVREQEARELEAKEQAARELIEKEVKEREAREKEIKDKEAADAAASETNGNRKSLSRLSRKRSLSRADPPVAEAATQQDGAAFVSAWWVAPHTFSSSKVLYTELHMRVPGPWGMQPWEKRWVFVCNGAIFLAKRDSLQELPLEVASLTYGPVSISWKPRSKKLYYAFALTVRRRAVASSDAKQPDVSGEHEYMLGHEKLEIARLWYAKLKNLLEKLHPREGHIERQKLSEQVVKAWPWDRSFEASEGKLIMSEEAMLRLPVDAFGRQPWETRYFRLCLGALIIAQSDSKDSSVDEIAILSFGGCSVEMLPVSSSGHYPLKLKVPCRILEGICVWEPYEYLIGLFNEDEDVRWYEAINDYIISTPMAIAEAKAHEEQVRHQAKLKANAEAAAKLKADAEAAAKKADDDHICLSWWKPPTFKEQLLFSVAQQRVQASFGRQPWEKRCLVLSSGGLFVMRRENLSETPLEVALLDAKLSQVAVEAQPKSSKGYFPIVVRVTCRVMASSTQTEVVRGAFEYHFGFASEELALLWERSIKAQVPWLSSPLAPYPDLESNMLGPGITLLDEREALMAASVPSTPGSRKSRRSSNSEGREESHKSSHASPMNTPSKAISAQLLSGMRAARQNQIMPSGKRFSANYHALSMGLISRKSQGDRDDSANSSEKSKEEKEKEDKEKEAASVKLAEELATLSEAEKAVRFAVARSPREVSLDLAKRQNERRAHFLATCAPIEKIHEELWDLLQTALAGHPEWVVFPEFVVQLLECELTLIVFESGSEHMSKPAVDSPSAADGVAALATPEEPSECSSLTIDEVLACLSTCVAGARRDSLVDPLKYLDKTFKHLKRRGNAGTVKKKVTEGITEATPQGHTRRASNSSVGSPLDLLVPM